MEPTKISLDKPPIYNKNPKFMQNLSNQLFISIPNAGYGYVTFAV